MMEKYNPEKIAAYFDNSGLYKFSKQADAIFWNLQQLASIMTLFLEEKLIIEELKKVYDPEMPSIDVFNLGLIYDIDIKEEKVTITHTLTSMLCPMADQIQKDIKEAVERVAGEGNVKIILTHTPPFSRDMLSEEAKLILNM